MAQRVHEFDWPDRLVIGTVGRPGERSFYLQARTGEQLVSALMEKEQSAALAEKLDEVLDELMVQDGNPFSVPAEAPPALDDRAPLDQPVVEQFRVGILSLGFDPSTAQVVIEAFPLVEDSPESLLEPESDEPAEVLHVRIPVGAARSFCKRTREVVDAGRPTCPLCFGPMDPEGHVCDLPDGLS
ncbi:DUF3090 family protein [Aeromicrobium sp. 636]|uniref:DUF3090 domain-containing protein n=1 Tax=Aeromicrobium senzhongii TaxID=2663859 RepID=A0A8I0K020_9ACTN|nr:MULTISPECIES: DUF3090 domain-containing protein [Aeromicrobium]MBC9226582.1 DUF3090 domain-containing protein [Aeromicrobium senzhongii]MCQ3998683.1 DUF3090 family protein [Aeromicrobium sp. 636]MTB89112.1 DUF3090 family protein [Aeromicrobium senzhongii]QNL93620.1 DUF3090 domain-containing protein [Aeromicrobium senzhongii]